MVITWIRNLKQGDHGYDALDHLATAHLNAGRLDSITNAVAKRMGNSGSAWERFYDRWQDMRDEMFAGKCLFMQLCYYTLKATGD